MALTIRLSLILCLTVLPVLRTFAESQFSVAPTGRIFMDGAAFFSNRESLFPDGVAIPEVRLGAKMSYDKWSAAVNLSFSQNKINLRSIYLNYSLKNDLLVKVGSFVPQYGLRTTLLATSQAPMISPIANTVFNDGLQLGGMVVYYPEKYLMALSMFTEREAVTDVLGSKDFVKESVGISTRLAVRPFHSEGKVVQAGVSGGVSTPRKHLDDSGTDIHEAFCLKSNFPALVVKVSALDATVDHAVNKWKLSPEILLNYQNFALESQYYYSLVNRTGNLPGFSAHGMYVIMRSLLNGKHYSYSPYAGVLECPSPGSMELVFDYDYTDLSDGSAGISGGQANNLSLTFNYYFNKYITARLRYGYTHTWNRQNENPVTLNSLMARLQVIF